MSSQLDHILRKDGKLYAGTHLLVDFVGASAIDDVAFVKWALEQSALEARATLLASSFHYFSENNGVSGVCVLAESHISIHTWPEVRYAAVDIFVCGQADPYLAVSELKKRFPADEVRISEVARGIGCLESQLTMLATKATGR